MINWLEFDIGAEWRKLEDKTLLGKELRVHFLDLQKKFHSRDNFKKYKYYEVLSDWFHDGNRDCGWIMSYNTLNMNDEKSLWTVTYRLFKYLQWSYALMDATNLLGE